MKNIYEAEETLLAMADIVKENRYLRERVEELRLKIAIHEARLYGMESLVQKLESRQRENLAYNSIRSMGGLSSDTKGFIDDMENLTLEELRFLERV